MKSEQFFTTCLLPEVLGHWYTRPAVSSSSELEGPFTSGVPPNLVGHSNDGDLEDETFCICNGPDEGSMICCDNDTCKIMWFHLIVSK